jgi:hypothetical protein
MSLIGICFFTVNQKIAVQGRGDKEKLIVGVKSVVTNQVLACIGNVLGHLRQEVQRIEHYSLTQCSWLRAFFQVTNQWFGRLRDALVVKNDGGFRGFLFDRDFVLMEVAA